MQDAIRLGTNSHFKGGRSTAVEWGLFHPKSGQMIQRQSPLPLLGVIKKENKQTDRQKPLN